MEYSQRLIAPQPPSIETPPQPHKKQQKKRRVNSLTLQLNTWPFYTRFVVLFSPLKHNTRHSLHRNGYRLDCSTSVAIGHTPLQPLHGERSPLFSTKIKPNRTTPTHLVPFHFRQTTPLLPPLLVCPTCHRLPQTTRPPPAPVS